jgi:hypothetical protein
MLGLPILLIALLSKFKKENLIIYKHNMIKASKGYFSKEWYNIL